MLKIWESNDVLLNDPYIIEEITGEIRKYFQINDSENTAYAGFQWKNT